MAIRQQSGLASNQIISKAIQKIALQDVVSKRTGAINGTSRIVGFVVKIHNSGKLAGTIDVQEYVRKTSADDGIGYHEGVRLSAIQSTEDGVVLIPKLYSEVVVVRDPSTRQEYVSMFSHVDTIVLDSHEQIIVGVSEREGFDETNPNSKDIDELDRTGVVSKSTYTKDGITLEVSNSDGSTTSTIQGAEYTLNVNDTSTVAADDNKIEISHNDTSVIIEDNAVYLGDKDNTDYAILGTELASFLSDLVSALTQMTTTTSMGPQPPVNLASFISLKAKIDTYKNGIKIMTKKVLVQK